VDELYVYGLQVGIIAAHQDRRTSTLTNRYPIHKTLLIVPFLSNTHFILELRILTSLSFLCQCTYFGVYLDRPGGEVSLCEYTYIRTDFSAALSYREAFSYLRVASRTTDIWVVYLGGDLFQNFLVYFEVASISLCVVVNSQTYYNYQTVYILQNSWFISLGRRDYIEELRVRQLSDL
jgi:hypothetical protein